MNPKRLALRIFKRIVRVVIGQDDGSEISISDLFIKIDIDRNISGKPNDGMVEIYNLSEATENQIKEKGTRIRVSAGYDGEPILIHDGDIRRVDRQRSGVDRITKITLGGNLNKISQAVFNKSYSGQIAIKQIVEDSIESFDGLTAIDLDQIPEDENLFDFSFTGKTPTLLDKILNPINVQWFETDNFIRFSARDKALENVVLLSPETGLVGSVTITEKGIKFKSVLNGRLVLNEKIKIDSSLFNGVLKITKANHRGDNREGEFLTEGVGTEIEQS